MTYHSFADFQWGDFSPFGLIFGSCCLFISQASVIYMRWPVGGCRRLEFLPLLGKSSYEHGGHVSVRLRSLDYGDWVPSRLLRS